MLSLRVPFPIPTTPTLKAMQPTLPRIRTLAIALLALGVAGSTLAATPFHFALDKAVPADESSVDAVPEVKLWFTEPPSQGTVSIRLLDADGNLVETTEATQDTEDPTAFAVKPATPPPAGRYTVRWRGMGGDGHVVTGELGFTVATP
jgi:methionine-rich copper-binding protein CopC